jgi:hypothetical protein
MADTKAKKPLWSQEDLDRLDSDLENDGDPVTESLLKGSTARTITTPPKKKQKKQPRSAPKTDWSKLSPITDLAALKPRAVEQPFHDPGSTTSMQDQRAGAQLPGAIVMSAITGAKKASDATDKAAGAVSKTASKVAEKTPRPIKAAVEMLDPRKGIIPVAQEQIRKQGHQMLNTSEAAPEALKDVFAARGEHKLALAGADQAEIDAAKETYGGADREIGLGDRFATEFTEPFNYLPGIGQARFGKVGAALLSNAAGEVMNPYGAEDIRNPLGRAASGLVGGKLFMEGLEHVVKPGIKALPEIADAVAGIAPGSTRDVVGNGLDALDQGFRTTADALDNLFSSRERNTLKRIANLNDPLVAKQSRHAQEALDNAFPAKVTPETLKEVTKAAAVAPATTAGVAALGDDENQDSALMLGLAAAAGRPRIRSAAIAVDGKVFEGLNHHDARVKAGLSEDAFWDLFDAGRIDEGFVSEAGEYMTRDEVTGMLGKNGGSDVATAEDLLDEIQGTAPAGSEDIKMPALALAGGAAAVAGSDDSDGDGTQKAMGLGLLGSVLSFGKRGNFGGRVTDEAVQEVVGLPMHEAYAKLAEKFPKFAKHIGQVDEVYNRINTPENRATINRLIDEGKLGEGWYKDARGAMKTMFGEDSDVGADLVATYSKQQNVGKDSHDALVMKFANDLGYNLDAFVNRVGGVAGIQMNELEKALRGEGVGGPDARKIVEYAHALKMDPAESKTHGVVLDRHMGKILPELSLDKEVDYDAFERLMTDIANERGVVPEDAQAMAWVGQRGSNDLYSDFANKPGYIESAQNKAVALGELDDVITRTHNEAGGSTFDPRTGKNLVGEDEWAFSPYKDLEWVLDETPTADDIAAYRLFNREILSKPGHNIGTWFNQADGKHYLDVTVTNKDRDAALKAAKAADQKAIFNLKSFEELPVAGAAAMAGVAALASEDGEYTPEQLAALPPGLASFLIRPRARNPKVLSIHLGRALAAIGARSLDELPEPAYQKLWGAVDTYLRTKGFREVQQELFAESSSGSGSLKGSQAFNTKVLSDVLARLPRNDVETILAASIATPTGAPDKGVRLPEGFDPQDLSFAAQKPGGAAGGVIAEDAEGNKVMVKSANWASNPLAEHTTYDIIRKLWPEVPHFDSRYVGGLEGEYLGDRLAQEHKLATGSTIDPFKGRPHHWQPNPRPSREFFIRPLADLIDDIDGTGMEGNVDEIGALEVEQALKHAVIQSLFSNGDLHGGNLTYLASGDLMVLDAGWNLQMRSWGPLFQGHLGNILHSVATGEITVGNPLKAMQEVADAVEKLDSHALADVEQEIRKSAQRWWGIQDRPTPEIDATADAAVARLNRVQDIVDIISDGLTRSKKDRSYAAYGDFAFDLEMQLQHIAPVLAALGSAGYFASNYYNEKDGGDLAELADQGSMGMVTMAALAGFQLPKGLPFKKLAAAARAFVKRAVGRAPQLDALVDNIANAPDENIVDQVFAMMRQPNIMQRLGAADVIGDVPRDRGVLPPQEGVYTNAELGWAQTPDGGMMRTVDLGPGARIVASNFVEPDVAHAYQRYTDALYVLDQLHERGIMSEKLYESAKSDWRKWHSRQLLSASYLESAKVASTDEQLLGVLQAAEKARKDGRLTRQMFTYIIDAVDGRWGEVQKVMAAGGVVGATMAAMSPEEREQMLAATLPLMGTITGKNGKGPLSNAHGVVEEAGGVIRLIRYMKRPDIDVIDPHDPNIRTGVPGDEQKRMGIPGFRARANFYKEGVTPEQLVTMNAPFKYEVEIPRERIADPDQTTEIAQELKKTKGYFDATEFEEMVARRGFAGYENLYGWVAVFDPVKVSKRPMAQPGFASTELVKSLAKLGAAGTMGVAAANQDDDAPFRNTLMLGAGLLTANAFGGYKTIAAGAKAAQDALNAALTSKFVMGKEKGNRTMRYLFNGYGLPETFNAMRASARRQLAAEMSQTQGAAETTDFAHLGEPEGSARIRMQQIMSGQIAAKGHLMLFSGTPIYQRYSELTKRMAALGMPGPQARHYNIHDYHTKVVLGELMHAVASDATLWKDGPQRKSVRKLAREELKARRRAGALLPTTLQAYEDEIERLTRTKTASEIRALREAGYERISNKMAARTPLRGKWVRKDVIDELQRIQDTPKRIREYGRTFQRLHTLWKRFHTVDNPATHVTNVISNMVTGEVSGVLPMHAPSTWKHMNRAFRELNDWLRDDKVSPDIDMALKLGMLQGDLQGMQEFTRIESVLKWGTKGVNSPSKLAELFGAAGRNLRKVGNTTQGIYQFEEQLFKLATFKRAISKGSTPEEAVKLAEKWFFDYSDVSPLIDDLRTQWWGIPFITWSAKMFPRMTELAADNPIKVIGALGTLTAISQVGIMSNTKDEDLPWWLRFTPGAEEGRAVGVTPQDAMRPKHLRSRFPGDVPAVNIGSNESPNLLNIGKYMPTPFMQPNQPGDFAGGPVSDVVNFGARMAGGVMHDLGGPLMRGLAELGGNRHWGPSGLQGSPITEEGAPPLVSTGQFLKHQAQDFMPPLAPGGNNFNAIFGTEPWRKKMLEADPENPEAQPKGIGERILHGLGGLSTTGPMSDVRMEQNLNENVSREIKHATYMTGLRMKMAAAQGDDAALDDLSIEYDNIVDKILAKYGLLN